MTDSYDLLPDTTTATVWRGLALPLFRSAGGYFRSKNIVDLAWSSIIMIMTTPRNFRVMVPEFGAGLYEELFEEIEAVRSRLQVAIAEEAPKWDSRILSVSADVEIVGQNAINIFAQFRVRGYPETVDRRIVLARQSLLGG